MLKISNSFMKEESFIDLYCNYAYNSVLDVSELQYRYDKDRGVVHFFIYIETTERTSKLTIDLATRILFTYKDTQEDSSRSHNLCEMIDVSYKFFEIWENDLTEEQIKFMEDLTEKANNELCLVNSKLDTDYQNQRELCVSKYCVYLDSTDFKSDYTFCNEMLDIFINKVKGN